MVLLVLVCYRQGSAAELADVSLVGREERRARVLREVVLHARGLRLKVFPALKNYSTLQI